MGMFKKAQEVAKAKATAGKELKDDLSQTRNVVNSFNVILQDMTKEFNLQNKLIKENGDEIRNLKREIIKLQK